MGTHPTDHVTRVTRYYSRNTAKFLRFGENDAYPAIHIALWPAGTESVADALAVAHQLIVDAVAAHEGPVERVVDLGCGMGAALLYLADHVGPDIALEGLTLGTPPPRLIPHIDSGRVQIHQADFHHADAVVPSCSIAFSIEAMAHSNDLDAFLQSASRMLDAGGRLIILDDFAESESTPSRWLETYRAHWLVPGVRPLAEVVRVAAHHGLVLADNRDLTPWIRLGRPRDRFLQWTRPLWGWLCRFSDYAKSLSGGDARQRCLASGETCFRMVQFQKASGTDHA